MKDHDTPPRSTIGVCGEGRRKKQLKKNRKLASKRVTIDSCNMLPMLDCLTRLADSIYPLLLPFPYPPHVWFRFRLSVCGRRRSARLHLNSTWNCFPSPSLLPTSALALCFLLYRGEGGRGAGQDGCMIGNKMQISQSFRYFLVIFFVI